MPKSQSLLDRAKNLPCKRRGERSWLERLPEAKRDEVIAVLKAKMSGEIDASAAAISELFRQEGINASRQKVQNAISNMRAKE